MAERLRNRLQSDSIPVRIRILASFKFSISLSRYLISLSFLFNLLERSERNRPRAPVETQEVKLGEKTVLANGSLILDAQF